MRPEESKALFDGFGDGHPPRRRGPLVLGALVVLAVGAAVGAGIYAWIERGRAADAVLAEGRAAAERDAAIAAKAEADRQAEEAVASAEKATKAAQEVVELAVQRVADAGEAGDLLRGVVTIWAGGTPTLAPPAVHELIRGEVLERLEAKLPPEQALELVGAAVRAMAIDVRARDSSRVRVDFDFAKAYLARAQKVFAPDSAEVAAALRNVAAMCFAYQAIPAIDEPARVVLRENARLTSERALAIDGAKGGRAAAESLATLGRLARLDGDAQGAREQLEKALAAIGADGAVREVAAISIDLARAELARGSRDAAVARLGAVADRLARELPFGDELELDARALRLSIVQDDEAAAMSERLAVGRVLVQLGRAPVGYETLARAARHYASDPTRFRERLEASVWLARALDQMGSTAAALELLDQPRLAEDARIFGSDTLLAKEFETTRVLLRARLKK